MSGVAETVGGGATIGRRASGDVAYMLPRHHTEIDRLDIQHYALRAAIRGNYIAPVSAPGRILDVGAGTGQWAYDICSEFLDATVVGFDMEPPKPNRPGNFRLVTGNLLHGLPFGDDTFDFVHQRLMIPAIPVANWRDVMQDLLRVTRPGGFIELVEVGDQMEPTGPASKRLRELWNGLAASFGLDSNGAVIGSLDSSLREHGAVDVARRDVALPVGDWGDRIGSLMASDMRALFTRLCKTLEARLGLPAHECDELLRRALNECEELRSRAIFTFVYGRKRPGAAA
jgi:SAM-dependent methyltransferase